MPGRDHDRFGIGFYYTDLSSDLPGILLSSNEIGWKSFTTSQRPTGFMSRRISRSSNWQVNAPPPRS